MLINSATLTSLYTGFNASFQSAFAGVEPMYQRVATTVPSTTGENEYGWIGQIPSFEEWIGDRAIQSIGTHGYTIKNKSYVNTIGVKRPHIEDDNVGVYRPLFEDLGYTAAVFPDELIFGLLKNGFTTDAYDGQFYFDTDHPVLDANGDATTVSNHGGGASTPWFLLDTSRPLKPLIYQSRKPFDRLVRKDQDTDDNVFMSDDFLYGMDGRCNVGFGFWQMGYGSKQPLDAANYKAARAAMGGFKGDFGRPLGIKPNLLVVPPSLEGEAVELLSAERGAAGASNIWRNTAEILVVPWLA